MSGKVQLILVLNHVYLFKAVRYFAAAPANNTSNIFLQRLEPELVENGGGRPRPHP